MSSRVGRGLENRYNSKRAPSIPVLDMLQTVGSTRNADIVRGQRSRIAAWRGFLIK